MSLCNHELSNIGIIVIVIGVICGQASQPQVWSYP